MEDLITLEEYKLAKDLAKTDKDDQYAWYITAASSIIQAYLGREFSDTGNNITEVFSLDYDASILYLDKYPVSELVSIEATDPYGYDSTVHWPVSTTDYYVDNLGGRLIKRDGGYWPQGPGAVIVTYKAGYPGGVGAVPADLKQATIDLVTYYIDEEYKPNKSMRGATVTNPIGYSRGGEISTSFPPHIQRVLDLYK
jgi:hypothetical protein